MGRIVGSAIVSHHPGLMQCEEFRKAMGAGEDSDLIAGFKRLKDKILTVNPDVILILDSHWFTTGYHLVDAGQSYEGLYTSDEMPWYLYGVPYKYRGYPDLAHAIEKASRRLGGYNRAIAHPDLDRQYATINVIKLLGLDSHDIPFVSASSCQNCEWQHFLDSGKAIKEAIEESDLRVVILASGALSHRFSTIDAKLTHPRIFHESNVSSQENMESDKRAIALMQEGNHAEILNKWNEDFRLRSWEAFGAHYLQMLGALGGEACTAKGEPLSQYENARGTGNIHMWFATE